MTLTCQPAKYETPDEAARDMKRALVLLRRRIAKRYGIKRLPFIVVFERTQRGWPHMHLLARAKWIDHGWLSAQMRELIGAPVVGINKIQDGGRAAAYVSKYIGKDPFAFKGCKRWWRSHNYEVEPEEVRPKIQFGLRWEIINRPFRKMAADILAGDYEICEERSTFIHFKWRVAPGK